MPNLKWTRSYGGACFTIEYCDQESLVLTWASSYQML